MTTTIAQRELINSAYERRFELRPETFPSGLQSTVEHVIDELDSGRIRVAEPLQDGWQVNEWVKKAVMLYFRLHENRAIGIGAMRGYDKVPLKYEHYRAADFARSGTRVVPPATVRLGAYIAPDVVLMPSYVNIGAYVGSGSMIDTWATVGSCAQIGERVHLSGGAGIGGVLEPPQAAPTIIEDECFIGARSEIVEGVRVGRGCVIAMGVFIGQSTRIFDRETGKILYGHIPAGSVVVPGSLPASDGSHSLACAVIVKTVDQQTRKKVGINALLRNINS